MGSLLLLGHLSISCLILGTSGLKPCTTPEALLYSMGVDDAL